MSITPDNPFRIHGTVRRPFFTDRDHEIERFARALREPGQKMLVYGHRRTGKTSTLENAVDTVNAAGGHAFLADLSTVTTVADMTNRILLGATKAVGRRWTSFVTDLAGRMQATLKITPDPASGFLLPSVEVGARGDSTEAQQASLANVLDTLDKLAGERGVTLGLVLDEFQEVNRLGGEQNEWHLRGTIQRHQHISYIAAGSKPSLVEAMTGKGRAFYDLLDPYLFGPIEQSHMCGWIDERMIAVGLRPEGAGTLCVAYAGARTRDIVRLARKSVDRASDGGRIGVNEIAAAFREIVDEDDAAIHGWWEGLTPPQQNALRAVAGTPKGLTTAAVRRQFGLQASGTVTNALRVFVDDGRVVKTPHGSGYAFDNPFVRGWVVDRALPDLGLHEEITHVATATGEYDTRRK